MDLHQCSCENCQYNNNILSKIKDGIPDDSTLYNLTDIFKVLGDMTRLKIIWVLFDKETCVSDIASIVGMSVTAISHQLRILRNSRLIKSRRDGKNTFYSLDDDHVKRIIEQGLIHINE